MLLTVSLFLAPASAVANPYEDENAVPKDPFQPLIDTSSQQRLARADILSVAASILRFRIDWQELGEGYTLAHVVREMSGTAGVLRRSAAAAIPGSYQAELYDLATGAIIGRDGIGIGQEFRQLVRSITFRLPDTNKPVLLKVFAENPTSGVKELVLNIEVDPTMISPGKSTPTGAEVRLIRAAQAQPAMQMAVYAEGYRENRKDQFFADAQKLANAVSTSDLPLQEHFEIRAVFSASAVELGGAQDLGLPVQVRNSFLGLYYPYWRNFGRWYHVVYPTNEEFFRTGLATVPYDYPVVLIDSTAYFGVGNYNEMTAIPARNASFTYLLLHEFGHFMGLNEEYESGGPTELAFAPGVDEPWSPNITFHPAADQLKWKQFVASNMPLPTPASRWRGIGSWGAYAGGYAQTPPMGMSHKPGMQCTMNSAGNFCPVCSDALHREMDLSLGF